MPNHLKLCGCKMCRDGMRRRPRMAAKVKGAVRRNRRSAKVSLRQGEEPQSTFGAGRTD